MIMKKVVYICKTEDGKTFRTSSYEKACKAKERKVTYVNVNEKSLKYLDDMKKLANKRLEFLGVC